MHFERILRLYLFLTNLQTLFFLFFKFMRLSFSRTKPLQSVGEKKASQGGEWKQEEEKIRGLNARKEVHFIAFELFAETCSPEEHCQRCISLLNAFSPDFNWELMELLFILNELKSVY